MISITVHISTDDQGAVDVRRTGSGLAPTDAENLIANAIANAIDSVASSAARILKQPVPVCETDGPASTIFST